ncbi:MAG TPA: hypothetical protein VM536_16500 [Chloroflexia bacterium]|nr:hypothetical protein [Chloroflexia bacterium]
MTINLDWQLVELAFVVATALLGFLIGWKYMAIWTVGVFFATIVASKLGPRLGQLLDKVLAVGAQFLGIALNGNESAVKAPTVVISDAQQPLAVAVFFLLLVLFAAWVARALGNSIAVGLLGKILGLVFGGLGTVLVLSELSTYYQQFVQKNGSDPLAGSLNLSLPTITLGFGGTSGATDWAGLGTLAMALFLMLLIIYTIWRVVRVVI